MVASIRDRRQDVIGNRRGENLAQLRRGVVSLLSGRDASEQQRRRYE